MVSSVMVGVLLRHTSKMIDGTRDDPPLEGLCRQIIPAGIHVRSASPNFDDPKET